MKFFRSISLLLCLCLVCVGVSQSWQRSLTNPPGSCGVPLLLLDGTVMVHNPNTSSWWKLTPTVTGNYRNGTWSTLAVMPSGHAPLYYASAVLADGRVVLFGGEYNGDGNAVWSNRGAIYNPLTNAWAVVAAPTGWANIGDAQCAVLPDGRFILANPFDTRVAIMNPANLTWVDWGVGKTDRNDEEGWTLLRDGNILTVDAINAPACEKLIVSTGQWVNASSTPQLLTDPGSQEMGPAILLPDGRVLATGATGHNAIYTPGPNSTDPGSWASAPDFPPGLDIADGPGCLLPSGNVLVQTSPGIFGIGSKFFEFNGVSWIDVPETPRSPNIPSYVGNFLVLPSGEVMLTDFSNDVEFYSYAGSPNNAWRPTITNCPTRVFQSQTIVVTGTQFNGLSQCCCYGDDASNATNYPLVRITNSLTGHVRYCRTSNHSTMAVATGATPVWTKVFIPANIETGPSTLQVVANGIASATYKIAVGKKAPPVP